MRRDPASALGPEVLEKLGRTLPFLFKVLSAGTPLSIQAHPSKRKAQLGYERENLGGIPVDAAERNYRDPNHKPEMAVALTHFELVCGFRPVAEIIANMRLAAPGEFERSLERLERDPSRIELSVFFYGLVSADERSRSSLLASAARKIAEALDAGELPAEREGAFRWALRIMELFPGDVGAIMPLILNHVVLEPGQAAFIAPGELHAHLSGTCLEIMANSDNVIRGALTPKFVDLPELVSVLSFNPEKLPPSGPPPSPPARRPTRSSCPISRSPGSPSGRGGRTEEERRVPRYCSAARARPPSTARASPPSAWIAATPPSWPLTPATTRSPDPGGPPDGAGSRGSRLPRFGPGNTVTIWADGDSLQAELRRLLCRRAIARPPRPPRKGRPARFRAVS